MFSLDHAIQPPAPGSAPPALLREAVLWWRALGIARFCPFTTAVLRRVGRFEAAVRGFVRARDGGESLDVQRSRFLDRMSEDDDLLVAAVAATEAALFALRRDPAVAERRIAWPQDPDPVFDYFLRGEPFPAATGMPFMVAVGGVYPDGMTCWRL